ncbi:MAG: MopE-related protein, partial [Bradymonadaceae bacterium]
DSTGACETGTMECTNGSWGTCQGSVEGSSETCDGKDNDCDGNVDENLTQTCGSSTGQCQTGTKTCTNGSWGVCQGHVQGSSETCDGKDNDCDGNVDENLTQTCGTSTGQCQTGTKTCSSGSWGSCQNNVGPSAEICDSKDNDCDGTADENPAETEGFEGSDSGWNKFTTNKKWFNVDTDHTNHTSGGSQAAKINSTLNHGICGKAGGVAKDFDLKGNPTQVAVDLKADVPAWGRVNVLLKDSNGIHKLWEKKGNGSGFNMSWDGKKFDISQYDSKFKLIFGNADNSSHCDNSDHGWSLWVDDVEIRYTQTDGFEGSDPKWSKDSTNGTSFTVDTDHTNTVGFGSESAKISGSQGICGKAGGVMRSYSLASSPNVIWMYLKAEVPAWGRVNVVLKDSSGYHVLWEKKGGGSGFSMSWDLKSFNVSKYDKDFKLYIGNADDSQYCTNSDHDWTIWADAVVMTQTCP